MWSILIASVTHCAMFRRSWTR